MIWVCDPGARWGLAAGAEGMAVGEIAKAIDGTDYPGGHLERELEALYHDGRLSPPAALWAI